MQFYNFYLHFLKLYSKYLCEPGKVRNVVLEKDGKDQLG
jgi:hypothetical protein